MNRVTVAASRTRNALLGLAILPGVLYGIGWLAFGQYAGDGFWTHTALRLLGAVLLVAACNLAWRVIRGTQLWRSFGAYVGCFGLTIALTWLLLAR